VDPRLPLCHTHGKHFELPTFATSSHAGIL
jgi:hypothetical protein